MDHEATIRRSRTKGVAKLQLHRGRVNALNETVVSELRASFEELGGDPAVRSVVLTGSGNFFSFGWDVPEIVEWPRARFAAFLADFVELYRTLFLFPKPVVAALNGHAIAGGCMIANACDERLMVGGKAKISLNEVTFGAAVPPGSAEIFAYVVGARKAEELLLAGSMLSAEQAHLLGWVDRVVDASELEATATERAGELGTRDLPAYAAIKRRVRRPTAELADSTSAALTEFVEIWYSESTREQLRKIRIRE